MQWKNVKLIYHREMRDQLRDRRTLFLIAVLPLLLYPLLGMSFFQMSQFLQHHAAKVLVLGADELNGIEWLPPLVDDERFDASLFDHPPERDNLALVSPEDFPKMLPPPPASEPSTAESDVLDAAARRLLDEGRVDVILAFPPGFNQRLREVRRASVERRAGEAGDFPEPIILFNSADDKSQLAQLRLEHVLRTWRNAVSEKNLADSDVPKEAARPFELRPRDLSQPRQRHAAVWSKILPFFVFLWALTGAFYPAVDLCAGEKERGTLETLLTSPALRREIVWGKLLTVMTFSVGTALLNFASLGLTGKFVIDQLSQIPAFGDGSLTMPPLDAVVWLVLALVPVSALFSGLCLACAAFARSTKEGQYYLMPLLLVTMPLMLLTMSPGIELNLGNSLVPLTGLVLLLRSVIEGQYLEAAQYVLPVTAVTLSCCLLAIRWAEEQFHRESVLFRESERLELKRWLVHVVRDRGETPSFGQAMLCVAVILVVQFYIGVALSARAPHEMSFPFLAKMLLISQIACILAPAIIMTAMLARNPARTLLLERAPRVGHILAAAVLAVLVHPLTARLAEQIANLYPLTPEARGQAEGIATALSDAPNWWLVIALLAVLPAVCEEIAFRGFVLSGFRHVGHKWWAIGLSAVAFGAVHMFLTQKLVAASAGLVIGYLAVQTGSLWPAIAFHVVHNSIAQAVAHATQLPEGDAHPLVSRLLGGDEPLLYQPATLAVCGVLAWAILWQFRGTPFQATREEQIEEARQRQDSALAGV